MKYTLLEMVQSILSDMDSEPVNSIDDSVEAQQVASVIKDTFFSIASSRLVPETDRLLKLTSLSDSTKPTHFRYPSNCKEIRCFEYDRREIKWVSPMTFLSRMPDPDDAVAIEVLDPLSNVKLYVKKDQDPSFYTSFDDQYIICNSYDALDSTTLTEAKTRCWGTMLPVWESTDEFVTGLDDVLSPYLLSEAKSMCFELFKSGTSPKVEQAAKRLKSHVQNDLHKTRQPNKRNLYGRSRH